MPSSEPPLPDPHRAGVDVDVAIHDIANLLGAAKNFAELIERRTTDPLVASDATAVQSAVLQAVTLLRQLPTDGLDGTTRGVVS